MRLLRIAIGDNKQMSISLDHINHISIEGIKSEYSLININCGLQTHSIEMPIEKALAEYERITSIMDVL